jgi:glycoside/pentoside/hexuronide:cation symporter, GPH family
MLFGTVPMTIFFILMYYPPVRQSAHGTPINAVWFAFTCGAFLFLYTLVVAPYLSLIPEIARTSDDRVKLSSWHAGATIIGLVFGAVVSGILVGKFGIRGMAITLGLFSLATIIITALSVKERPPEEEKIVRVPFWKAVIPPLKNPHFLIYAVSISSFWLGYKVLQSSIIYVCTNILCVNEDYVGAIMAGMLVVLLVSLPFVFFLYSRFGKKKLFLTGMILMVVLSPLQGLVLMAGKFMNPVTYYHIVIALMGFPIALMMVIYNAVLSDVIDYDEKVTGFRREAMYYGMEGLFTKVARGIGSSLSALLFAIFGLEAGHVAGLLWAGPFCALFALVGVFVFSRYMLSD